MKQQGCVTRWNVRVNQEGYERTLLGPSFATPADAPRDQVEQIARRMCEERKLGEFSYVEFGGLLPYFVTSEKEE